MYIMLFQDGIVCKYMLGPLDLGCHSIVEFFHSFFCLEDLCIGDTGVLNVLETLYWGLSVSLC
jgi:hypothetical protein